MRKYVFIISGGILGAVSRYAVKGIHIYHFKENMPLNTLMINVSGSFILALLLTIAFEIWEFDADIRLGIATGFLGAYTTFSTFCMETVLLMRDGFYFSAVLYITVSTMIGLAAAYFGIALARQVVAKLVNKEKDDSESEEAVIAEINGEVD